VVQESRLADIGAADDGDGTVTHAFGSGRGPSEVGGSDRRLTRARRSSKNCSSVLAIARFPADY
jgi:hypothetical protein